MKIKTFAALLAAAFMTVSLVSCDSDETEDTDLYTYTIAVSLSNKGNLSDTAAAELTEQLKKSETELGTLTPTMAKMAFDQFVSALESSLKSTGDTGNTYFKITATLNNVTLNKREASKDFVIGTSVN